jgi:hypothetical protein
MFYNWLTYAIQLVFSLLQGSLSVALVLSDFYTWEAVGHISVTISAAVIVWALYTPKLSEKKGWNARINNFCYMAFKESRVLRAKVLALSGES